MKTNSLEKTRSKKKKPKKPKKPIGNYIMFGILLLMVVFYLIYINGIVVS